MSGPPKAWKWFLGRFLPRKDRESLSHELEVLYQGKLEEHGVRSARSWYRRQVLDFVLSLTGRRMFHAVAEGVASTKGLGMGRLLRDMFNEVRSAGRSLRSTPGITLTALVTLALGIGANAVIFSVFDHVALRPLPFEDPQALAAIWPEYGVVRSDIAAFQKQTSQFESVAGYLESPGFNLSFRGGSARIQGVFATPELLEVLRVTPVLGRGFSPEAGTDMTSTSAREVLLSYGFWQGRFGGEVSVLGQTLRLDGERYHVVGVLPAGYAFPQAGIEVMAVLDLDASKPGPFWGNGGPEAVGRLAHGASFDGATRELRRISEERRLQNPVWTPASGYRDQASVVSLQSARVGDLGPVLWLLLGAVGLVLIVVCANVANLLLARGLGRSGEMGVRAALGATRGRLVRQHIIESLLLASAGCVLAMVLAVFGLRGVLVLTGGEIPGAEAITIDGRVVFVGVVLALFTGFVSGALPAFKATQGGPGVVLSDAGGRNGMGGRMKKRLSSVLVVAQLAMAVVLVTGAGLLVRSLSHLASRDPGFATEGLATARVALAGSSYAEARDRMAFFDRLVEELEALPGVEGAAVSSRIPFAGGFDMGATFIDGVTKDPNDLPMFGRYRVGDGYFDLLGQALVEGRVPGPGDRPSSPLVAVINRAAAEQYWPGESPVGERIRYPWSTAPWIEIVGVVESVADRDVMVPQVASFYMSLRQSPDIDAFVLIRSRGEMLVTGVREAVARVDPEIPVREIASMESVLSESVARSRWTAILLSAFAGLALVLGGVGIYGVLAYSVRQRTREFGVRLALGAEKRTVWKSIVGDGMGLVVPGVILGLTVSVPAVRVLDGFLYGIPSTDPVTFGAVALGLGLIGLIAVALPALRAVRIDPAIALRGGN